MSADHLRWSYTTIRYTQNINEDTVGLHTKIRRHY